MRAREQHKARRSLDLRAYRRLSEKPSAQADVPIALTRGLTEVIPVCNGPRFIGKAIGAWAYANGTKLHFIRAGKPIRNTCIECFNGGFREGCLNEPLLVSPDDVAE